MGRLRRSYTREFKKEAARMVTEGGSKLTDVSRKLDVNESSLKNWVRQYKNPEEVFPINLNELIRENEKLKIERDTLKKFITIFMKGNWE